MNNKDTTLHLFDHLIFRLLKFRIKSKEDQSTYTLFTFRNKKIYIKIAKYFSHLHVHLVLDLDKKQKLFLFNIMKIIIISEHVHHFYIGVALARMQQFSGEIALGT